LIAGGPGRLWRLTSRGESFPTEAAFAQVCALLRAWWYQVDWQLPLSYRPSVDRLIAAAKWSWEQPEPYDIRAAIGSAVQRVVVDPLAEFGMLSAQREREALPHCCTRRRWPSVSGEGFPASGMFLRSCARISRTDTASARPWRRSQQPATTPVLPCM